jgi:hypothetical protein
MRIVALSDQHGFLPAVPPGDLLIVAGDICVDGIGRVPASMAPDRQAAWFDRHARPWIAAAPTAHSIVTWGNHDWCGQACDFPAERPGSAPTTALQIVVDEMTTVPVTDTGRARPLSIWATLWSNEIAWWAFTTRPAELAEIYAAIPEGLDILVSHQPPCSTAAARTLTTRADVLRRHESRVLEGQGGVPICHIRDEVS